MSEPDFREYFARTERRRVSGRQPVDAISSRVREESSDEWGPLPPLTAEQRALVDKLVADGLEIQHNFRPEPLYKETGTDHYEGSTVEDIQKARRSAKSKGNRE